MKIKIKLFGRTWLFSTWKTKKKLIAGITNVTADNKYCVFIDYDNLPVKRIINEIRRIQNEFELGTFYIFQSSAKGHHAICLDKVSFQLHKTILKQTTVDDNYLNVPSKYGQKLWTLRQSEKNGIKPTYLFRLVNRTERKQSTAHADILSKLHQIKITLENPDNKKEIITASYKI